MVACPDASPVPAPSRLNVPAALLAVVLPLVVCGALWWPIPAHLDTWHVHTAFADSHVWVFDHFARRAGSSADTAACGAGYPLVADLRAIGWAPGLLILLLRPLLGALGAANLIQLLSLPASALAAAVFVRRSTDVEPITAALLGVTYGLCPTLLGTFATGEISNTQAWLLPAFLLAADATMQRGLRHLGWVAAIGLAAAFTSPYYALSLPVLAAGFALARARTGVGRVRGALLLGTLALSLLPAHPYYAQAGGRSSVFRPASASRLFPPELAEPAPVAQPETFLWATHAPPNGDLDALHVPLLGLALVAVALFAVVQRRGEPGHRFGLALSVGGMLAALGPRLYAGGLLRGVGSFALPLPVALLEALAWPTRQGGMYYRYSVIAVLGLIVLAAVAVRRHRFARLIVLAMLVLNVAQGIHASGPWATRARTPVAGRNAMLRFSGTDGAVLELPVQGPQDGGLGQAGLLRAVFHGRPTTSLPRGIIDRNHPTLLLVQRAFSTHNRDHSPRDILRNAGIRLVVLPEDRVDRSRPSLPELEAALGAPERSDGIYVWDLGPEEARCVAPKKR